MLVTLIGPLQQNHHCSDLKKTVTTPNAETEMSNNTGPETLSPPAPPVCALLKQSTLHCCAPSSVTLCGSEDATKSMLQLESQRSSTISHRVLTKSTRRKTSNLSCHNAGTSTSHCVAPHALCQQHPVQKVVDDFQPQQM